MGLRKNEMEHAQCTGGFWDQVGRMEFAYKAAISPPAHACVSEDENWENGPIRRDSDAPAQLQYLHADDLEECLVFSSVL